MYGWSYMMREHTPCVISAMIQFILDVISYFNCTRSTTFGHPALPNRIIESKTAIIVKICVVNIFHFVEGLRLFCAFNQCNIGGWRSEYSYYWRLVQSEHVQNLLPFVHDLALCCCIEDDTVRMNAALIITDLVDDEAGKWQHPSHPHTNSPPHPSPNQNI